MKCQNCQRESSEQYPVRLLSFDMDLPTVALCSTCSALLQLGDLEMFNKMWSIAEGKRGSRRKEIK